MESKVAELPLIDQVWTWFETNKKPVAVVAGIALVVGLVVWFFTWQSAQKEIAASDALSNVAVEQITSPGPRPDMATAYLNIAARYPNSSAAARGLLMGAGALFADGKFPEAQAQFEKFTREHHDSPFMGEAQLGIAACLDAEGKVDASLAAYKDLSSRHSGENVVLQAKFSLARLYETQNKPELARDLYAEVEREDRYGSKGIESGIRLEELIAKFPKLAPSTQALTNAPIRIEKNK